MAVAIAFLAGGALVSAFLAIVGYRDRVRAMMRRRAAGCSSRRRLDALRRIQA